jgi:hypothetical protein
MRPLVSLFSYFAPREFSKKIPSARDTQVIHEIMGMFPVQSHDSKNEELRRFPAAED